MADTGLREVKALAEPRPVLLFLSSWSSIFPEFLGTDWQACAVIGKLDTLLCSSSLVPGSWRSSLIRLDIDFVDEPALVFVQNQRNGPDALSSVQPYLHISDACGIASHLPGDGTSLVSSLIMRRFRWQMNDRKIPCTISSGAVSRHDV